MLHKLELNYEDLVCQNWVLCRMITELKERSWMPVHWILQPCNRLSWEVCVRAALGVARTVLASSVQGLLAYSLPARDPVCPQLMPVFFLS